MVSEIASEIIRSLNYDLIFNPHWIVFLDVVRFLEDRKRSSSSRHSNNFPQIRVERQIMSSVIAELAFASGS